MALDLDPAHLPTLAALRVIAIDAADWDRAARYLDQEQMNTEAPRARAKLLVELGKLRDEMLGEHELAVQAYELALASDADNEDAALPLVNEYVSTEQWPRAEPLAEMLAKKAGKRERAEQHRLQNTLGKVLARARQERGRAQGLPGGAPARPHRPRDHPRPRRRVLQARRLGRRAHQLPEGADGLARGGDGGARHRLLQARPASSRTRGRPSRRSTTSRRRSQVEPAHRDDARRDGGRLRGPQGLEAGLPLQAADPRQHRRRPASATACSRTSPTCGSTRRRTSRRASRPSRRRSISSRRTTSCSTSCSTSTARRSSGSGWSTCSSASPTWRCSPKRKSRYLYTMAQLYRDKLEDQIRAVDLFNEALDLNPGYLEAFERINKILTGAEGVEAARARLPEDAPPRRRQGEHRPRVQPLARARAHLPRPPDRREQRRSRPSGWRRASSPRTRRST